MFDFCIVADKILMADCIANYFGRQPESITYIQKIDEPTVSASRYVIVSDDFKKICKFCENINTAGIIVITSNTDAFFVYKLMLSGINVILDYTTSLSKIYEVCKQVPLFNRIQISPNRLHDLLEGTCNIPKNDFRLMKAVYDDMKDNDRFFDEKFKLRLKNYSENYGKFYAAENSFFKFLLKYNLLMYFEEDK